MEAYNLIKDLEPSVPREYVLKGVVFAALGQKTGSREHLKLAQQLFQLVGASTSALQSVQEPRAQSGTPKCSKSKVLKRVSSVLVCFGNVWRWSERACFGSFSGTLILLKAICASAI